MSPSKRAPGAASVGTRTDIAQRSQARNLVHALQHALQALPLYGHDSPASQRAVESLRQCFRRVWNERDSISMALAAGVVRVEGAEMSTKETGARRRRESILQLFPRVGIVGLRFHRGFEVEEIQAFLTCVVAERHPDDVEDLATALWRADFEHLEVDHVALTPVRQDTVSPPRDPGPVEGGAPDDPPALPEALTRRTLLDHELCLGPEERDYLDRLVEEEERRPVCHDVVSALMDSLQDGDETLRQAILEHLQPLLPELLEGNRLRECVVLLQELRAFAAASQLGPSFCTAVQRLLGTFDRSPRLAAWLRGIEAGEIVPELETLSEFVACLGNTNVATLVRIAERVKNKEATAILRQACESAVKRHPDLLLDLLRSEDDIVLRGAMSLVGPGRGDDVVREVIAVLNHREARLRLAAAKALLCLGTDTALQALVRTLEDDDEEVRQTSAWALATWKYRPAAEPILRVLKGPRLRTMVLNEKLTYFDAYARLAGRRAVAFLDQVLNERHLFRRRFDNDMRACAARGLGQVPGPEAQKALRRAENDKDDKVRRIVQRHLRREVA